MRADLDMVATRVREVATLLAPLVDAGLLTSDDVAALPTASPGTLVAQTMGHLARGGPRDVVRAHASAACVSARGFIADGGSEYVIVLIAERDAALAGHARLPVDLVVDDGEDDPATDVYLSAHEVGAEALLDLDERDAVREAADADLALALDLLDSVDALVSSEARPMIAALREGRAPSPEHEQRLRDALPVYAQPHRDVANAVLRAVQIVRRPDTSLETLASLEALVDSARRAIAATRKG